MADHGLLSYVESPQEPRNKRQRTGNHGDDSLLAAFHHSPRIYNETTTTPMASRIHPSDSTSLVITRMDQAGGLNNSEHSLAHASVVNSSHILGVLENNTQQTLTESACSGEESLTYDDEESDEQDGSDDASEEPSDDDDDDDEEDEDEDVSMDESREESLLLNGGDIRIPEDIQEEIDELYQTFPSISCHYKLVGKIGEGTFSTVYKAVDLMHESYENSSWEMIFQNNSHNGNDKDNDNDDDIEVVESSQPSENETMHQAFGAQCLHCVKSRRNRKEARIVAVKKIYVTSSPRRIANEIGILRDLTGSTKIAPLITAMRHEDQVIVVMPYFRHDDFRTFYLKLPIREIQWYMSSLVQALEYTHRKRVMHRDVKPSNFLYNVHQRHGVLVDFGLAEREDDQEVTRIKSRSTLNVDSNTATRIFRSFDIKGRPGVLQRDPRPGLRANRAGTRGFRAPEVLLKIPEQSVAIDVWSVGVILLCFFTKRFPFFQSTDDIEALLEISVLFGRYKMEQAASEMGRTFFTNIPTVKEKGVTFERLIKVYNHEGWKEIPQDGLDFLRRCLCLNPEERITAKEALSHPFIANISTGSPSQDNAAEDE
ncbi:Cell division control protein 7 [Mycoemilia scoparia]|uniref:non-specific serine/threonine protein kinase n=1 Tax=Mycoemilia scoparia TaxID=417184 RepID=A0A9W8DUP5_9FUNG|nr:Cell division control protein 7 [Mycoemilia scoparia]